MLGRRPEDPLNGNWSDEALERAVELALDVEPAPEFLARVRTHVESQPKPESTFIAGWQLGAVSVMLAAALATGVYWTSIPPARQAPDAAAVPAPTRPIPSATATPEHSEAREGRTSDGAGRVPPQRARAALSEPEDSVRIRVATPPAERSFPTPAPVFVTADVESLNLPEVVIAPDERIGLALLLSPPGQELEDSVADLPDVGEIEVPPLVLQPLARIAQLEGDFQ